MHKRGIGDNSHKSYGVGTRLLRTSIRSSRVFPVLRPMKGEVQGVYINDIVILVFWTLTRKTTTMD
ncbi:hypothetical protein HNQ54_004280 [Anaerocolumna cellulosilytica]|nr:hypothetical protein [Anaerocolumna cellulosilytica]